MTNYRKLPYASYRQGLAAWPKFQPGTGRTATAKGELFELLIDEDAGFRVWFSRDDTTGHHYAIDYGEAVFLGLEG